MKSLSRQRMDGTHMHENQHTRRVNRSASYKHNEVLPRIMSLDTDIVICGNSKHLPKIQADNSLKPQKI